MACMGVIFFLVCVRKHKSNLRTNIRTISGEENTVICRKMQTFEWNQIPALFYDNVVCFLLPKCVFFYQCCLSWFSSQQYMFLWFCKTVLVKKYTPCQGMIWFSLSNVTSFTLALMRILVERLDLCFLTHTKKYMIPIHALNFEKHAKMCVYIRHMKKPV